MTERERQARRRVRQIPELQERLRRYERAASIAREHGGVNSRLMVQRMGWVRDELRMAERARVLLKEMEAKRG